MLSRTVILRLTPNFYSLTMTHAEDFGHTYKRMERSDEEYPFPNFQGR